MSAPKTKKVNSFAPKKFEDHTIVDSDTKVVGHIRIKPNTILWSPRSGKDWYGISLSSFAAFMIANGRKQKK